VTTHLDGQSSLDPGHPRIQILLGALPKDRQTILEIGARHGSITRLLRERFASVTALDLEKPSWQLDGVNLVQGDVQKLEFADNSFDCVMCTEVLEHVPDVVSAAREIQRVARHEMIISVPYRQDTRVGRLTCSNCGKINPPYGHLNRFSEQTLRDLFPGSKLVEVELIGQSKERTNALSSWLQDCAGNPYGDYNQEEPCVACGVKFKDPGPLSFSQRLLTAGALTLVKVQDLFLSPQPIWIQCLFRKASSGSAL